MKKLLRSATNKWLLLAFLAVPVLQIAFPSAAYAQTVASPTFEIKTNSTKLSIITAFGTITLEDDGTLEIVKSNTEIVDPIAERKVALKKYLTEVRPSRLAEYADVLAEQPEWRKIVAISFVESTFCKRHYFNNCWGITYRSGLARYPSLKEAIVDTNRVLVKSYSDKTYEQMNGVYVQPKNPNWLRGAKMIETELDIHVEPKA